ncbi:MAG TPA: fused MFS/spermidine synthase [Ktedonobacteraceae bacterium]|nr:fused MFS/spermidine synthase [Ktedonobacteraceae bacterium]
MPTAAHTAQGWLLILLVFVAGACSLAVEVSASRLLAPYFGDTLFVWANLIGLILLYLTAGYYIGGRLADRYPRATVLYMLTGGAALLIALIPLISQPVLTWTQRAFADNPLGVFYGSFISVILLFLIPTVLLGCVSPFAIRLRIEQVGSAGSISGKLYAISTVGSMLGTFLPVLLLLPNIGTARTFFAFALALALVSLAGWPGSRRQEQTMAGANASTPNLQEARKRTLTLPRFADYSLQTWMLLLLVFVEGACALAVEISASRLLAPYFGTSLFIWANLIGLILLYLTVGYYVGGRFADRYPSAAVLYTLTIAAACVIALIPLIARPIMAWSQSSFATYSVGVFYGSLASVILLFAIPVILLSCVSPFAIRLQVEQVGRSGSIAGKLYAISTAGSIVGTFLPALVLIPSIGTYRTFFAFAVVLLLTSILGLLISSSTNVAPGARPGLSVRLLSILLLIPMIWSTLAIQGPIKPADGSDGGGTLLTERESAYNYIQVVNVGHETQLILNEGVGIHSIYDPDNSLTGGPWDYFLDAPYFNNPPFTPQQVRNVCVIGLGAGTIPRELTAAYGPISIDGVELDGEIVNLARQHFHMNEPNLHVIVQDGRYYLQTTQKKYDEIGIDAYQQPYVPFQLATKEFFQEVRSHLTPTGVAVINAGRTNTDLRLVEALAQTMHAVFPNVYIVDTARFTNSIIIATNAPTSLSNFRANTANLSNSLLQEVATSSIQVGNLREEKDRKVFFTDDQAPVEQLIDSIILDAVRNAGG